MEGRILGIDLGERRIGLAISDELGVSAQSMGFIPRKGNEEDINALKKIIEQNNVTCVVVGYPLNMNGTKGTQASKVGEFIRKLRLDSNFRVIPWDERLSTKLAEKVLIQAGVRRFKRRTVIDQLSAVVILQSYLDSKKP